MCVGDVSVRYTMLNAISCLLLLQVAVLVSGLILTVATGLAAVYMKRAFESTAVKRRGSRRSAAGAAANSSTALLSSAHTSGATVGEGPAGVVGEGR